jgi:hypothetical protein
MITTAFVKFGDQTLKIADPTDTIATRGESIHRTYRRLNDGITHEQYVVRYLPRYSVYPKKRDAVFQFDGVFENAGDIKEGNQ